MIRVEKNRIMVLSLLIGFTLSGMVAPQGVSGQKYTLLPETAPPVIDGNVTSLEWRDAVRFNTTINEWDANVFVTRNGSSVYFAVNFTQPEFVALNMTEPENATNFVPGLNNTHDFFALQIDNNFDRAELGTENSPDDVVVINRYVNESVDAFADGNTTKVFTADEDLNGTTDGSAVLLVVNQTSDKVSYEFVKNVTSTDKAGHDFNFNESRGIQFRFLAWFNTTADAKLKDAAKTEWFTLKMNETGSFATPDPITKTNITIDLTGFDSKESSTMRTALEFSGYNVIDITDQNITDYKTEFENRTVLVFVGPEGVSTDEVTALAEFLKTGGRAMIFLSAETEKAVTSSESLANQLGLSFIDQKLVDDSGELNIPSSSFGGMEFFTGASVVTDEEVNAVQGVSYALNYTGLGDTGLILDQDYISYDIFDIPAGTVLDENGNNTKDADETLPENVTVALGFDLLKGGRVIISAFNPISTENVLKAGNVPLLYRALSWVTKQTHALLGNSLEVSDTDINQHDKITVTANATDIFGNALGDDLKITAIVLRAGSPVIKAELTAGTAGIYATDIKVDTHGWQQLYVKGSANQYGFVEYKLITFFSQKEHGGFNVDFNVIVVGIGVGSTLALGGLAYVNMKKYANTKKD